jgi:methyl-accepting chemotaxis protein-1 (serine sensor receptor)
MNFLDDMKIGTRLALTYAIVLLLMLGILYEGYSTLSQIAAQAPQFQATISGAQTGMLVMGVLALLLGTVSTARQARTISAPLADAVLIAETVASGDLSHDFENTRKGEFGRLLEAMGTMEDTLTDLVTRIKESTAPLADSSQEIADSNADLARHTLLQAEALDHAAVRMTELTATVRENAQRAHNANGLAGNASGIAQRGGVVVGEVVQTMQSISNSSRQVVDIIAVIEGISFQTNILALNAAVEAARAGEQGRGFAVVAGEVRVLAQRSAEAAKQIRDLISHSAQQVEAGAQLVDRAGHTMQDIVQAVQQVTDLLAEISTASAEQSRGVNDVSESVARMQAETRHNTQQVTHTAEAASDMNERVRQLQVAVDQFKV